MSSPATFVFLFLALCSFGSLEARPSVQSGTASATPDSVWFGRVETGTAVVDTIWLTAADGRTTPRVLAAYVIAQHGDFSVVDLPVDSPIADSAVVVRYSSRHNLRREGTLFIRVEDLGSVYSIPVPLAGESHYADPIYSFTDYLSGKPLVDALRGYVQGHTALTYNQARDLMFNAIDKRPGDTLECPYSGRKIQTANRQDAQSKNFNTEHTWPQSLGAQEEPPKSDLYHLRATDLTINDKRANYPFGDVVGGVQYQQGGSKLGTGAGGSTVFEVRDRYKGDIARGMFYFAVRYNNPSSFLNQQEAVLRRWSTADAVDTEEATRNTAIAQHQKRRNPFIDHPEFLERIYSLSGGADFPSIANPAVADSAVVMFMDGGPSELPLWVGNRGNDTAVVRSVEVRDGGADRSDLIASVDSALAPDGRMRILIRRPEHLPADDSLVVTIRFTMGVPQQKIAVRFAALTAVEETPVVGSVLRAVPTPFSGEALVSLGAVLCAEPTVTVVTLSGQEVPDIAVQVEQRDGATVARLRTPASLPSGLFLCRIACGNRVFLCPLTLVR